MTEGVYHGDSTHGAAARAVEGAELGEEILAEAPHLAPVEQDWSAQRAVYIWPRMASERTKLYRMLRRAPKAAAAALMRLLTSVSDVSE